MKIQTVLKKIIDSVAQSACLMRQKRGIRKNTIYCQCKNIEIPLTLKKLDRPENAQYIITDRPLKHNFMKKSGQIIAVTDAFVRTDFFGEYQRTLIMADFLLCRKKTNAIELLNEFEINGIFSGRIISQYENSVLEDIISGKYSRNKNVKNKKRVLIYSGSLAQNGLTASLMNLLSHLDNSGDVDYMITYREESLKDFPERLKKLSHEYRKIPISGGFCPTFSEMICYVLYFKLNVSTGFVSRRIERMFKREWQRLFGELDIDTAIQFTGYEYGVIKLFQQFSGKRVIFVHNDMVSEINCRHNQHLNTLREAYSNYDTVAMVTEDMRESTLEIGGTGKNVRVIPNCHDYKSVLEKAQQPIEFQLETECNVSHSELIKILDSDMEIFITIGRFSPEKAHFRLIDAFADHCKINPNKKKCLIIIGGRGELYEQTVKYAEKTGLEIILIKSMENPMPVLKRCSLFMLPSEYEGLGLVLLEADTLGIPVFATNIPGPSCFLKEYGGTLTENSRSGITNGMRLYAEGKIKPMHIDFEEYNRKAVQKFKEIL